MSEYTFARARRATLTVPAALLLAVGLGGGVGAHPASAQIPGGLSPDAVANMIPSEITVPAGQTTTVDVGVPVDVNYSAGGWVVTSNGTSVSVTAPAEEGATAAVPASAGGYTATVNLVAVGGGQATDADEIAGGGAGENTEHHGGGGHAEDNGGGGANGGGDANGEASNGGSGAGAGSGSGAVNRPERKPAEKADTADAKRLDFEGEIHGNEIVVKVPLSKARDLMKYANYDSSNAKLRYLDVNGNIIEGVKRDVNVAGRTLTLTYPEGETPDNPFIMEVVENGAATFVAVITSTNAPVEQAAETDEENPYAGADNKGQGDSVDSGSSVGDLVPLIIGGGALIAALALLIIFLRKRSRGQV
ncbi:hypothetical protein [Corynebacterium coyleae]|uniref:hypothetical protein n=1 Tax=Corynebacterium coyleae TaxID=53374 RepID=UPI00254FA68A|nr:hypothetical protein [Corynebacterium coyleae]MDK8663150.1 hypothetical protein [Corynebacterium coyleae]MDK8705804.1 hypothetical protein [Corynebacterium coyleae]MDK8733109.1 hypothetical protein [Corynebacterium coyleae]MDK8891845.1 hypothetical protein [Corynebacterium coyleae]